MGYFHMNTIVFFCVAMMGQHAPSAVPVASMYDIRIYKTHYEGMTFYVRGYYRPDIRRIIWNADDEFNIQSYAIAIVTQCVIFAEPEDDPPLVKKPLIASRAIYIRRPATAGTLNGTPGP